MYLLNEINCRRFDYGFEFSSIQKSSTYKSQSKCKGEPDKHVDISFVLDLFLDPKH